MARNFPATSRLQSFYTETYDNEVKGRLRRFYAKQRGGIDQSPNEGDRGVPSGLPAINPGKYAREVVRREKEQMARTIEEAKKNQSTEEMKKAPREIRAKLYDGFSKEGKGKKAYLRERHDILPEQKYAFPVLSSMKYGWQIEQSVTLQKPKYGRSTKIFDTFYTRNGIPDIH